MKKTLLILATVFLLSSNLVWGATISIDNLVTGGDLTLDYLNTSFNTLVNAANSLDGNLISSQTISADSLTDGANPVTRWNEAFTDWVVEGLLAPTSSGTLTSTATQGTAFVNGVRVRKDATSNTYTAQKWTWADLSDNGTYTYIVQSPQTATPAVTANSVRLFRASSDATQVHEVTDLRNLSGSFTGGAADDFQRADLYITVTTPDNISVWPGVVYYGTTRIAKVAIVSLDLATAADWAGGVSGRGTSTDAFVAINEDGDVKLTEAAPTLADASSNTAGRKRYSSDGGDIWRALGWFFMNLTGSGNIDHSFGNYKDGDASNVAYAEFSTVVSTASTSYVPSNSFLRFYSSGRPVKITAQSGTSASAVNESTFIAIDVGGVLLATSEGISMAGGTTGTGGNLEQAVCEWTGILAQGSHTISIYFRVNANTSYLGRRSIRVEEL